MRGPESAATSCARPGDQLHFLVDANVSVKGQDTSPVMLLGYTIKAEGCESTLVIPWYWWYGNVMP